MPNRQTDYRTRSQDEIKKIGSNDRQYDMVKQRQIDENKTAIPTEGKTRAHSRSIDARPYAPEYRSGKRGRGGGGRMTPK